MATISSSTRRVTYLRGPPREHNRFLHPLAHIQDYLRFPAEVWKSGSLSTPCTRIPYSVALQAHHIDLAFYDEFYNPGVYLKTHAAHMARWHSDDSI